MQNYMKHREAEGGRLLRHWIKANPQFTMSIETKQTEKDYINFSEVKQAQLDWGLAIMSDKGVLMRVEAVVEGMPDYVYLRNVHAFICVKYPDFFCFICVDKWVEEVDKGKKSLTK